MRRVEVTPALWDEVAAADPSATVFHTRAWAESAVESFDHARIETRAFVLDDGAIAVLPLLARRYGVFGELQCAPDSTFGGPIAQRALTDAEVGAIVGSVQVPKLWRFAVAGNPYAPWRPRAESGSGTSFTQTVELRRGVPPLAAMHPRARTNVHRAERDGLEAYVGRTDADLDEYVRCYEETLARWGSRTIYRVSRRRFEAVRERLGDSFRLWLVRFEGRVIGGDCVLYHGKRAFYWHAASSREGLRLNAGRFVQSRIMEDAWRRGFEEVDLGTSNGMQGLEYFKESLGAEKRYFEHFAPVESAVFRVAYGARGGLRRLTSR